MFKITKLLVLLLAIASCTPNENIVQVEYVGCDIPNKVYTTTASIKDVRDIKPDEVPSFCTSIKVYYNGTLAYTLLTGDRLDGINRPRTKNKSSDNE